MKFLLCAFLVVAEGSFGDVQPTAAEVPHLKSTSRQQCTYPGGQCYELRMQKCEGSNTWTLHGLWAEWANECPGSSFDVNKLSSIRSELNKNWLSCPEYGESNEEFWTHEWSKHGTCSGMSELAFFQKGLQLRDQHASRCGGGSSCSVCFSKDFSTLESCPNGELLARHRASPLPARLVKTSRTPANTRLEDIDIALISTNFAGLQRELEDRANPNSPHYAQWLSDAEVTKFVQASDEAIGKVTQWIRSFELEPELNNHRDYLTIRNAPASKIEAMLGAELYTHRDTMTKQTVNRVPGSYSIPSDVAQHVSKIFPIHSVPVTQIKARKSVSVDVSTDVNKTSNSWPSDCQGSLGWQYPVTPAVTRALYNYDVSGCTSSSTIAAMLPGPFGLLTQDVSNSQKACGLPSHPMDKFVGKNDVKKCSGSRPDDDECFEPAIDAQIIGDSADGCHTEFWNGGEGSFISMFKNINSAGNAAPRVFSFSFGDPETERDDDVPNTNKEFAKIVAKGITLVSASGDNGAGKSGSKYVVNFPPSSPYILGVGSTSLKTSGNIKGGEVAVKEGWSAGGFSSVFSVPAWQSSSTKAYLASGAKFPSSGFTRTGRGVPDISVLGSDWGIIYKGGQSTSNTGNTWTGADGTSCSGPFIASLVARLNAARLAKGQGTMGFMHQWLYSKVSASSGAIYDVTEGSNKANPNNGGAGFSAAKGWDPVTGLGTPNYKLLEALAFGEEKSIVV